MEQFGNMKKICPRNPSMPCMCDKKPLVEDREMSYRPLIAFSDLINWRLHGTQEFRDSPSVDTPGSLAMRYEGPA